MDIILYEKSDIRVSAKKPEKLRNNSLPVNFFRREERETISEIESELATEKTIRYIPTSEVFIINSRFDKLSSEVEVLFFWVLWHGEFT